MQPLFTATLLPSWWQCAPRREYLGTPPSARFHVDTCTPRDVAPRRGTARRAQLVVGRYTGNEALYMKLSLLESLLADALLMLGVFSVSMVVYAVALQPWLADIEVLH